MANIGDLSTEPGGCHETSSCSGTYCSTSYDWDDCISSIKVAQGWRVWVYRDNGYNGEWLDTTTDVPNLQLVPGSCNHDGLNDCISSIRVARQ